MVLTDRNFNTSFFEAAGGGDPILYQHLFSRDIFKGYYLFIPIAPLSGILCKDTLNYRKSSTLNNNLNFDIFYKKYITYTNNHSYSLDYLTSFNGLVVAERSSVVI